MAAHSRHAVTHAERYYGRVSPRHMRVHRVSSLQRRVCIPSHSFGDRDDENFHRRDSTILVVPSSAVSLSRVHESVLSLSFSPSSSYRTLARARAPAHVLFSFPLPPYVCVLDYLLNYAASQCSRLVSMNRFRYSSDSRAALSETASARKERENLREQGATRFCTAIERRSRPMTYCAAVCDVVARSVSTARRVASGSSDAIMDATISLEKLYGRL